MNYRTTEQFDEIQENAMNGNWTDAGNKCAEYGFYANDLINAFGACEYPMIEATDIAILAEIAQQARG